MDDTDGLEPTAEFDAWKLRELMRIKRDREAQYAREKEREEVEARRALPEALRMKEDMERAQKTRDEKSKGNQGQSHAPALQLMRCSHRSTQSSCRSTTTRARSTPYVSPLRAC